MHTIRSVFFALSNLAASINTLAGVIDAASSKLRQHLALNDAPAPLDHQPLDGDADGDNAPAGSNGTAKRKTRAGA